MRAESSNHAGYEIIMHILATTMKDVGINLHDLMGGVNDKVAQGHVKAAMIGIQHQLKGLAKGWMKLPEDHPHYGLTVDEAIELMMEGNK
jgi:hypothetical protein